MRRVCLTTLAVLGTVLAAAPASAGDTERVKTRVTINDDCSFGACRAEARARRNYTATFFGRVRSREARCERNRTVDLYREVTARGGATYSKIDTTRSGSNGAWEIVRDDKPGFVDYFVRVRRAVRGDLVCKRARSANEAHDSI
jgi:hypothetical protein